MQEHIDIIVRERGARVVKRKIENIGSAATNATRGLRLLQNSLFVLGGAGILRGLINMLDTLTNFENRLRLVTDTTRDFNFVQEELFRIANQTRTSFEASGEVYTRTALAVRQLGISQSETLQFTESLNKAVILSGASAREANAAMIQLSQGLSSNRLSGDELRSVLEQLPYVADVIAKSLGVTRGELRKMGREGKISALTILKAFRDARVEIDDKFGQTVPTVGQSLTVFRNRVLELLDAFDDATGATALLAQGILFLGEHLGTMVKLALLAGSAFAAFKLAGLVSSLQASYIAYKIFNAQVAAGTVLIKGNAVSEGFRTAAILKTVTARKASIDLEVLGLRQGVAQLTQNAAKLRQQKLEGAIIVKNGRARSLLTGKFVTHSTATANLNRTTRALLLTERALKVNKAQLTLATTAQTGATNTLSVATARSNGAQVAQAGLMARLGTKMPLLAGGFAMASRALAGLGAVALANPLGAIVAAIAVVVVGLFLFSDRIKVTADGIVSLKDLFIATFQILGASISSAAQVIGTAFQPVFTFISQGWTILINGISTGIGIMFSNIKNTLNMIIGLFDATISTIRRSWAILPDAIADGIVVGYNAILTATQNVVNGLITAWNNIPDGISAAFTRANDFVRDSAIFIVDSFKAIPGAIKTIAENAADHLKNAFFKAVQSIADLLNMLPGIAIDVTGSISEVVTGIDFESLLPNAPSLGANLFNLDGLNLDEYKGEVSGKAAELGKIAGEEFSRAMSTDYIGDGYNAILTRARENAEARLAELANLPPPPPPPGGGGGGISFDEIIQKMSLQNELLKVNASERIKLQEIAKIENQLKRELSEIEKDLVLTMMDENEMLKVRAGLLDGLEDGQKAYEVGIRAITSALEDSLITTAQSNDLLRQNRIAFLDTQTTMSAGLERGFLRALEDADDAASKMEDIFSSAFDGMANGLAEFVQTGKFDFASLIQDINKKIIKLVISQAFQQLFGEGGFLGGGKKGGFFGGLLQSIGGLLKSENGAQFTVGANSGLPIPGVDNRLMTMRVQDGETVTVTPKGQGVGVGGVTNNNVTMNISTPDVKGFQNSQSQIAMKMQSAMSVGRRNA